MAFKISGLVVFACTIALSFSAGAGREQVDLPEFAAKHLNATMRDHLEALERVTRLLSERKYGKAADIAEERLGMSSVEIHYEKHVGKYMPREMRLLGTRMHEAATSFAESARRAEEATGAADERVLAALADVIEGCTSCHEHYRTQ